MRFLPRLLINTPEIELWPARLLSARSNRDARALAASQWLLRRKSDGCYLAASQATGLLPLVTRLAREPGIEIALDALETLADSLPTPSRRPCSLPLDGLIERLTALGLEEKSYRESSGLPLVAEPGELALAGMDRFRRPLWLLVPAARAWQRLQAAAIADGIALDAISGYRSHAYQLGIFRRKLARGQLIAEILAVNAAPGFSEHHSGRALDIGSPGQPPAEESFELTYAYRWLQDKAADFGFQLSYPRNNRHGIVFEPWHWCWQGPLQN